MRTYQFLIVSAALALLTTQGVLAADATIVCGQYGRFAPMREVTGAVISTAVDGWGFRHVVVADSNSGCRVFVLTENLACAPGNMFRGIGHMRSSKGEGYDATFHFHLSSSKAACQ